MVTTMSYQTDTGADRTAVVGGGTPPPYPMPRSRHIRSVLRGTNRHSLMVWKQSSSASLDMARNGEAAPNRAGIGHSVPTPTVKRSGLTGIIIEETDDPAPVHPQRSCGVS